MAGRPATAVWLAVVTAGVLWSARAPAEIAVLVTGDVLKIDAFATDGERMRLELRGGGVLTLPMARVERIVDDEIAPPEERVAGLYDLELGFAGDAAVPDVPFGALVHAAAKRYDLNPVLIAAMMRAESAYAPEAISAKGARGLMQLMPATAERFGVSQDELFRPERNIEAGTRYLRFLVDRFEGNLALVLAAYNAGEGAVDRHGGIPPYRETQGYVARILGYLGFEPAA